MKARERISHFGVPVDNLTPSEALCSIGERLKSNKKRQHLVTLSIGMYTEARASHCFNEVLQRASYVIPESTGLALYSLICPPRLVNTPGGQLARDAVRICGKIGETVAIFGSSQRNREIAVNVLRGEDQVLKIVNVSGEYDFNNSTDSGNVVDQLDQIRPGLAIMAGNEVNAEFWISKWILQSDANVKIVGNFGQTIDVWAGQRTVPPKFFRDHKMGWLIRLAVESPERRKRYLGVLNSFGRIALQDFQGKHV